MSRAEKLPAVLSPGRGESAISVERALKQVQEVMDKLWEYFDYEGVLPREEFDSWQDRYRASSDDIELMLGAIDRS
jgi:hypothetical protein